jgi:5-methylcytosine-specific restriction protein B
MTTDDKLLDQFGAKDRRWGLAILRTLDELGGTARAKDVKKDLRARYGDQLPAATWDWIEETSRVGWTRFRLIEHSLLSGEQRGSWILTEKGRRALTESADEDVDLSAESPPADRPGSAADPAEATDGDGGDLETVDATAYQGWMFPALEAIVAGHSTRKAILEAIEARYRSEMVPGDLRINRRGLVVWQFNASWALSYLLGQGHVDHPSRGAWLPNAAGKAALADQRPNYRIQDFRTLRTAVRPLLPVGDATRPPPPEADVADVAPWSWSATQVRLADLRKRVDATTMRDVEHALRPEFGPSPSARIARNIILSGPPGTGKTWLAEAIAYALTGAEPTAEGRVRIVQFHPSYGYENFVWGIRPQLGGGAQAGFIGVDGPMMAICKAAVDEADKLFVLIIDEINRGDPARIFGELLYCLEYRGREVTLASGQRFVIPSNLVVIGTMNSVDRSVAIVDYALRRRFVLVRVEPNPGAIIDLKHTIPARAAAAALAALNGRIRALRDEDHQVGHSYFVSPDRALDTFDEVETIWRAEVRPQLAELFFGQPEVVRELDQVWRTALSGARAAEEAPDGD